MTKRYLLDEIPYKEIQVGEKVMFLSKSNGHTSLCFGFYRGMWGFTPVVEYFYREKKWHFDKNRNRYIQDKHWSIVSKRVFLTLRKVYSIKGISNMIENTLNEDDLKVKFSLM